MEDQEKIPYRYNHIHAKLFLFQDSFNLVRKKISHGHAASVDTNAIEHGVWASEVHIFKDIRREGLRSN